MKVLMVYPNMPLMMSPSIAVGLFNAISKEQGVEYRVFETTEYSDEYENRHIKLAAVGANRGNKGDLRDDEIFTIKPTSEIIPDFVDFVEDYQPDILLMSLQEDVFRIAEQLLASIEYMNIPHLIGGVFCNNAPDLVLESPYINNICTFEGEVMYRKIIAALKEGKDITSVDGVMWKNAEGKTKKNKPNPLCNISEVTPDFQCFENKRWQRPMGGQHFYRAVSMETYRGCPYKCTYCNSPMSREISTKLDLGNFMRRKDAKQIEKDLKFYMDTIGPDFIMFMDDSFLARPKREIFEFCEMWSKYNIPFWFNTRIENCRPEYLQALKDVGLYRMTFGLESGNEKYRTDFLKRPVKNEVYYEYFDIINDSNIPYSLNVIIGMPYETRDFVMDTARIVRRARGYDGLTIAMFQPYHGTKLRDMAVEAGFIDPSIIMSGGFLDQYFLKMPKPYLQKDDVFKLAKTFPLYAFYEDDMYDTIRRAETDEKLFQELLKGYTDVFYHGEYQIGGKDKINHIGFACAQHDPSQTYKFELA